MKAIVQIPTGVILLCMSFLCQAQVIKTSELDTGKGHVFINKFTARLKNSSLISIDSARTQFLQNKFSYLPDRNLIFVGYNPSFYSFRFVIQNDSSATRDLILMQAGLGIRDSELWQIADGNTKLVGRNGYKYPFNERPYKNPHHCFPITMTPNSIDTFYLNVDESHAYKVFGFVLNRPDTFKKRETDFYFLFGLMIGLLTLFMFFNVYLYFAIKEKIHLWYAIYLLFALLFLIKQEGLDAEFLGTDSEFGYRSTSMGAISVFAMAALMQVVQLFLINIPKKSFLYLVLSIIKWSAFLSGIAYWIAFYIEPAHIIESAVFHWANKTINAALIVTAVTCTYSFIKGYKPALFVLIGFSLLIAGGLVRALFIPVDNYLFPPSYFEIGMVAEAIIISFGLMYRYNVFKKEKEALKIELELQQKEAARQVILAQEAEQKRFAADLHDELGGNLAAIKLALQRFDLSTSQATELNYLIDKASTNARNISHNLMPPEFAETNLKELLDNFYRRLNAEDNTHFYFHYTGQNNHFDKQEELMIYRIVMELTHNIVKHSGATEATIQFIYHEHYLSLVAEDNGLGLMMNSLNGIGLRNVQSRVKFLNGTMTIDSEDNGTTIMIQIPYKKIHEHN